METDPNPFPKLELFSPMAKLRRLAHFLFDHIQNEGLSDHANRGGGPMLDRELYDQRQLDFEDQAQVGW